MNKKFITTVVTALIAVVGLSACGESGKDKATDNGGVEVIRNYEGELPAVEGEFGVSATIKPGTGNAPDKVVAKTLKQGDGPVVKSTDTVVAHYVGTLWDGTIFDSSFARAGENGPQPISFSLKQVIPGWTYGLADQKVGDRVQLVIPAQWGYGNQSVGEVIKPGSTLVFVVDIVAAVDTADISALSAATLTNESLPGISVSGDLGTEPKIEITDAAALPTDQKVVKLSEGTGKEITAEDVVLYHVVAYDINTKTAVQSSWGNEPSLSNGPVGDVPGVTGNKVGSRVLIYTPEDKQTKAAPVIFVVDITGTIPK
ncbi:FKBP-type peptidyl-prolyl cis-trans isomerase [Gleimia sp. 6138-11-ORH1]|uniref:FKBP-type peptidyl-prolyl cis-trans isomerase n=1 Tax=Gleimia sp. 6138-11-ORH1 TaxID=2973937 RepID=UPI00216806DC|nr:FKBP-type peptidyl-prolyl cis-trans isomerase [Gleimia sp. 6138-11-ORH1]MCS4484453.1 FKBP-type peptidyl-prolyl cis-trans isomerase [Gleimia sp. 6138-11-ORH1]